MLPVLTDPIELATYLIDRDCVLTEEELDSALCYVGRVEGPVLLDILVTRSLVTQTDLAAVIGDVWSRAEYPDAALGHARWLTLYEAAGYTVNGKPAARPRAALTLYRGAIPDRRTDWSWTDCVEVATAYARGGIRGRPSGTLWVATVNPHHLLARNTGRGEREYVVNTRGLSIAALQS